MALFGCTTPRLLPLPTSNPKFSLLLCYSMAALNLNGNHAPDVDFISTITDDNRELSLLVRVVRMWCVPDMRNEKLPLSLELVLMDSEGSRIHASLKKQLLYKFEKEITEDHVYYLSKFKVDPNIGDYRTTSHPFKLSFHLHTKIRSATNTSVPAVRYTFTSPSVCLAPGFDSDYLVDIIGVLTGVGQQREYVRNGVKSKLITIELDNMGYRFKVTLFGRFVDELTSFMSVGEAVNAVLAILFCKIKVWQGRSTIQSTMHSSKLLINPEMPEVTELRNNVAENQDSPNPGLSQIPDSKICSCEEDLLYQTRPTTIAHLKECKEPGLFVILATITNVLDDGDWWYTACNCTKKVYADENAYFCDRCNRHVFYVTPRYLLKLKAMDASGSANFVLFENEASALIKKSCADLLETMETPTPFGFPKEISALIGKEFLFKVQCVVSNDGRFERSFRVKRVSGEPVILQKFKEKLDANKDNHHVSLHSVSGMVALGAELANSVAQDLLTKFTETSKGGEVVATSQVIDLSEDSQDSPGVKRACPSDDEGPSSAVVLKEIKKEKD